MGMFSKATTKLFTVNDETYIGTHRTAPISFVTDCESYTTDCKSDNSTCKFHQPLQSVTVARTTIWLTITRRGDGNQFHTSWGGGGGD